MLINCNKPYVLKVNDVEWSPIGTREGKDEYIISSSGFFEILVDGERIFFFRNTITPDFEYTYNQVFFRSGGSNVKQIDSHDYIQTKWSLPTQPFDNVLVRVTTTEFATASALELSCNNGNATITSASDNLIRIEIRDYDTNEYLMLKLGNVLLTFITTD